MSSLDTLPFHFIRTPFVVNFLFAFPFANYPSSFLLDPRYVYSVCVKVIGPQFDGLDDSQGTKLERKKMKTEEQKENEELIDRMLRRGVGGGKTF